MPDAIPLKLLFQHQGLDTENPKWRLTALMTAETLRELLLQVENKPGTTVYVSAEMPTENMTVHVEVFEQGRPLSGLLYTKHLTENGWTTNHVTLPKSGTPLG